VRQQHNGRSEGTKLLRQVDDGASNETLATWTRVDFCPAASPASRKKCTVATIHTINITLNQNVPARNY
jgi:hypothetical protein